MLCSYKNVLCRAEIQSQGDKLSFMVKKSQDAVCVMHLSGTMTLKQALYCTESLQRKIKICKDLNLADTGTAFKKVPLAFLLNWGSKLERNSEFNRRFPKDYEGS